MQGTIIVIEGTDGSGKRTQAELLTKRLENDGYGVATVSFPQYDEPSSYFVRKYLKGEYGSAEEVGPYTGSLFYALDRFAAAAKIRQAVDEGKVVVLDRYVGSNMAHQGTKFRHVEERRGFFIWLDNLEFELLHIPRPNKSFVLRVPVETSLKLIEHRDKQNGTTDKTDIHEVDTSHLKRALEVYDDMCQLFPKDFTRVDCTYQDSLLPVETVHELLWRQVAPLLPSKPLAGPAKPPKEAELVTSPEAQTTPYFVPANLSIEIKAQYYAHLDRILELRTEIIKALTQHIQATGTTEEAANADKKAQEIADAVVPIASLMQAASEEENTVLQNILASEQDTAARDFAVKYLSGQHAVQAAEQVQLIERLPRNEMDALPDMLYPYSSSTLRELQAEIRSWPYDKKAEVYEAATRECHGAVPTITYTWDIVGNVRDFIEVAKQLPAAVSHQACSPRFGYNVPEILEDAGLSDQFEACFDISLGLYSLLQEAGHEAEAQYAVLSGHMLRWKLTLHGDTFAHLYHTALQDGTLMRQLKETVSDAHPLLAEALKI